MNYFVYALLSAYDGRIYIGMSKNPIHRIKEHNSGQVTSTKSYRPWSVEYVEKFETRLEARRREKYFKTGSGKEFIKSIIRYAPR